MWCFQTTQWRIIRNWNPIIYDSAEWVFFSASVIHFWESVEIINIRHVNENPKKLSFYPNSQFVNQQNAISRFCESFCFPALHFHGIRLRIPYQITHQLHTCEKLMFISMFIEMRRKIVETKFVKRKKRLFSFMQKFNFRGMVASYVHHIRHCISQFIERNVMLQRGARESSNSTVWKNCLEKLWIFLRNYWITTNYRFEATCWK